MTSNTDGVASQLVTIEREITKKMKAQQGVLTQLKGLKPDHPKYAEAVEKERMFRCSLADLEQQKKTLEGLSGSSASPAAGQTADSGRSPAAPPPEEEEGEGRMLAQALEAQLQALIAASVTESAVPRPFQDAGPITAVHPQVVEATVLMEEMIVVGCNARTMAMIAAFQKLLRSTSALNSDEAAADLEAVGRAIEVNYNYMCRCREATSGMRYVKETLLRRSTDIFDKNRENRALGKTVMSNRQTMLQILDSIETELRMSLISIVEERSSGYISSSDTILVFGRSSVVESILLHAAKSIQFKVIVIDSAPLFEGRELTQRLSASGVSVMYGVLTACCTLLPKATRVFIGASSVLQNGDVFSRCGTAIVAACAKSMRRPVLCFSESYKFIPEVWLGNIGQNHAAAHSGVRGATSLEASGYSTQGYLYDLTPAAYVDMIICEMGCLHTSAIVAAIKDREMRDGFL